MEINKKSTSKALFKHIYIIIRFYEIFNEVHPLIRHMELNGLAHSP